ncbi:ATP-binding protein [Spirillospora sp. NPDC050679]
MVSPIFAGRAAELAALRAAHARAHAGEAAVVLVGGEAGGGKTRLVEEFTRGRRALTGGCLDLGAASLPYAPFTAMLRRLGPEAIAPLASPAALRELARLLPALSADPPGPDDGTGQVRLFEHLLTLVERLASAPAGAGPLTLVVEDAHWADRSTLDLLAFLARSLGPAPVLLVVTHRPPNGPLRPLLAELARVPNVTRIDLPPLTPSEVTAQLAGLGRPADPRTARDVHRRSGGNPLFVEALAAHPGEDVPGSLRDLLLARVNRLPEDTRALLHAASAAESAVGHDLLAAVTGRADDDLDAALRPAVDDDVLVAGDDGYTFRHALIRDAVHQALLPGERARLHRRYATALEADLALGDDPLSALAAHWHAAGDHRRALSAAWTASAERGGAGAYPERLALLERVLELWDRVPDAAGLTGCARTGVLELIVEAAGRSGETRRGLPLVEELLAGGAGPERTATLLARRAWLHGFDDAEDEVADLLAAERAAAAPTRTRARVLAQLSARLATFGEQERAAAFGLQGLELARSLGDRRTADDLALTVAALAARDGDGDLAPLEALPRTGTGTDADQHRLVRLLIHLSHCYEGAGRSAEALRAAAEGRAAAERAGLARSAGLPLLVNEIESLVSLGRWDEAAERVDQALERHHAPAFRAQAMIWRTALRLVCRAGPEPDPETWATPFDSGAVQTALPLAHLAVERHLAEGDRAAARETARQALAHPRLTGQPRFTWPLLVSAARAGGRAAAEAEAVAGRLPADGPVTRAYAATFAAVTGTAPWDDAVAAWEKLGRPYPLALFRRSASRPADGLTPREHEVLDLLARGRSNRQIAEELAISPKTASVHVSNILAKLGAATRGEAAAMARDLV